MGKLKFTLSNILFWISLIASCLLLENVAFLTSNSKGGLSDTHFFVLFALAMIGYIAYFVIEHVKNKVTIDYFLLGTLTITFICGMIAIWSFKYTIIPGYIPACTYVYEQSVWDQLKHTLSLVTFFLTLYSVLFFFNKNYPSVRKIQVLLTIVIIICYATSIYSLITEWKSYVYNLTYMPINPASAKSVFWNANMFGGMLLMGVCSAIGLNAIKKNVFSYISLVVLFVMIVFVGSLTCIIAAFFTILFYFLVEIILIAKKNVKRGLFLLTTYVVIAVSLFVVYACALGYDFGNFSNFCRYIQNGLQNADYMTLSARTFTWNSISEFLCEHPINLLFGVGFRNSNYVIGGMWLAKRGAILDGGTSLSAHSGYLQIFMNFGLVGLLAYAAFAIYYIYCFIRLVKNHLRFAILFLIIGVAMASYAVSESVIFFNPNTQGMLVGIAFYLPMVNKWKHVKHHELGDDVLNVEQPKVLDSGLVTKFTAKVIMCLLAVTAALFVFPLFTTNEHYKYLLINIFMVLFISLLTLPIIISCLSVKRSRTAFIVNTTINLVLVFGSIATLIALYLEKSLAGENQAIWVYPILLSIVLIGEAIIFSVGKRRTFSDYLDTFIGAGKNSLMGLVGVGLIALATSVLIYRMDIISPLTFIVYAVISIVVFYLFSYFIPFKDNKAIVNHFNSLALYSLKKDVLKDRLGAYNEKRKD